MDRLWAPWRINYVSRKKTNGCVFCKALKEKKDKKNFIVSRSQYCFAILNTFPYNNGHVMIVPNRHLKSLENLREEELLDMNKVLIKIKSALKKTLNPAGFNIGMNIGKVAGAGIDKHIHIHIVPRWLGDINYMPVLANTKVVSQSLRELYTKLKQNCYD
ncbi:MAG: HIT domain-containing protein [Candidatus Omnitrophica bacterium]|nr:HIT domain-containing protein [Candidatus Omnitrophota bacterium]